jgi:hypothetical protein
MYDNLEMSQESDVVVFCFVSFSFNTLTLPYAGQRGGSQRTAHAWTWHACGFQAAQQNHTSTCEIHTEKYHAMHVSNTTLKN